MTDYKGPHQGAVVIDGHSDILFDILCERLKGFNDELECNILIRPIKKYCPEIVLGAATARGCAKVMKAPGPDTPMIHLANIAVVGDLFEVIPESLNELDRSDGRGC